MWGEDACLLPCAILQCAKLKEFYINVKIEKVEGDIIDRTQG